MALPEHGGIVPDMARMNKILEISIKDWLASVQTGIIYKDLQSGVGTVICKGKVECGPSSPAGFL